MRHPGILLLNVYLIKLSATRQAELKVSLWLSKELTILRIQLFRFLILAYEHKVAPSKTTKNKIRKLKKKKKNCLGVFCNEFRGWDNMAADRFLTNRLPFRLSRERMWKSEDDDDPRRLTDTQLHLVNTQRNGTHLVHQKHASCHSILPSVSCTMLVKM